MRQSKDQSGPQDRLMARRPTRKAKACARRKGQTAPQERPQYVPAKRANQPTRKTTVCASKKGQPAHKKDHSMCQQKWLTILQERPKYAPEQTSMRPTRKANSKIWVVPPSLKAKSISKKGSNAKHILSPPLQKDQKKSELEAYTKSSTPKGSNPKTEA
ncbi:hypothetical protein PHYBLDRAFT_140403 [Phycomyces blakesleeanus NRRL 1555(-)]|uniref:Uncharacterized protein n=1 Tax=Phycomyces blakesleeanus (strain ATCC 8743b / DSM 1359 / FGSC 10004 / NBRC 33097 / NRRL 1555) TaxID=763407 RepID=A0A162Y4X6_PHYB8|nr:hypothetical protein PHYBLDRAFT_140403 [Phycomyces blakesleeanus NRRL 1555(-)]OAD78305.1 hypothetical protein PHYBLDRAFT_140403 [Phycomyces blakesleeanus NRRL 1555(-)]|eukprot:XP_018296345.1 hypothetical protein PHYBLDRAFT_140403 [Phycomyces blakesleeanus NRRL 1555(-)]